MSARNPRVDWYPKDIIAASDVSRLTIAAEGAWRRTLDYIVYEGRCGAISRPLSWFAACFRVPAALAAELLAEIRTKGVGQVVPDPADPEVLARDLEVMVVCRRMERSAKPAMKHCERQRRYLERRRKAKGGECSSTAQSALKNSRVTLRDAACHRVTIEASPRSAPHLVEQSAVTASPEKSDAPVTACDTFPPKTSYGGSPKRLSLLSEQRAPHGPGPKRESPPRDKPPERPKSKPSNPDPIPLAACLAGVVQHALDAPRAAASSPPVPRRQPSPPPRSSRPGEIRDPFALARWAWDRGLVKAGRAGLHRAVAAAVHAVREGRTPAGLFWHLLRQPLEAWFRASDDDEAAALMRHAELSGAFA